MKNTITTIAAIITTITIITFTSCLTVSILLELLDISQTYLCNRIFICPSCPPKKQRQLTEVKYKLQQMHESDSKANSSPLADDEALVWPSK